MLTGPDTSPSQVPGGGERATVLVTLRRPIKVATPGEKSHDVENAPRAGLG
jgi:hypothetical protein